MDGKTHNITVLHVHNPHFIWVEVNCDKKNSDLQQIGVFGVIPRNPEGKASTRWDPYASETVIKFLKKVEKHSFKVTYCDDDENGTSIFDNKPHIFGDILGCYKGEIYSLASCLQELQHVLYDKKAFIKILAKGKIQWALNETNTMSILMKIVQHYQERGIWEDKKEMFFNHLTLAQMKRFQKHQAETLTVENLELHHRITSNTGTGDSKHLVRELKTVPKTYYDCSTDAAKLSPIEFVENTLRKLTNIDALVMSTRKGSQSTDKYISYIEKDSNTKVSDSIAVYYDEIHSNDECEIQNNGPEKAIGRANSRIKLKPEKVREIPNPYKEAQKFEHLLELKRKSKTGTKVKQNEDKNGIEERNDGTNEASCAQISSRTRMRRRSRGNSWDEKDEISSNASPKPKDTDKRLIAYGPPTSDLKSLVVKKAPIEPQIFTTPKPVDDTITPWNEDDCDSNIAIDLSSYGKPKRGSHSNRFDLGTKDKQTLGSNVDLKMASARATPDKSDKKENEKVSGNKEIEENCRLKNECLKSDSESNDRVTKSILLAKLQKIYSNSGSEDKSYDPMSTESSQRETEKDTSTTDDDSSFVLKKYVSINCEKNEISNILPPTDVTNSTPKKVQDSDEDDLVKINAELAQKCKPIVVKNPPKIDVTDKAKINVNPFKNLDGKPIVVKNPPKIDVTDKAKINVNPFKNLDGSQSVFVENLVATLLLAHTKNQNRVLPRSHLRDVPFKTEIQCTLRNMRVKTLSRLQSVSWAYILRGHSVFMVGSAGSGKTLGYLPAVCNLVIDYNFEISGQGPICIIVCATAQSVADVARLCKMFLNHQRVVTVFPGVDSTRLVTNLLNGCEILVTTPSMLCRFLGVDISVDLRRVTTVVFDDCERLSQVYETEVKAIQYHVKQMLKTRTDRQLKVQYVLASRQWCDFMLPLAKKAPDTIVTFAAFHECVLYSKTKTSVSYVMNDKKIDAVVEFLKETDDSKLTVIVCRSDDEVELLENTLKRLTYSVVACNNQMTLHDLYKLRTDNMNNSILICCDGNLNHLNVTRANYLIHFSMPALYSQFCARFSVLNENYPSIFEPPNDDVKIKVLLEENNMEQLPKILSFVKRCSTVPAALDEVARKVLEQKDFAKAQRFVPICDSLLAIGECFDMISANCQERHAILDGYDNPKSWVPRYGVITFKIIHYNSAVSYSARLLTHTTAEEKKKYPETYATLCMKLGLYYSKDENKRLHGEPKVGDICAVAVKQNFIARCQVLKVLTYEKGKAKEVVTKLIDEEQLEIIRAVDLYHLPDKFKVVETHTVKIRLANIKPQDNDVTFTDLAKNALKRITESDEQLYLRSRVSITIGNSIFVDNLEACQDLSALRETVVKHDLKTILLETHAVPNSDHILKLQKLCDAGNLTVTVEKPCVFKKRVIKNETEPRWAHLDKKDWSEIFLSNMINAGQFFIRLEKFDKCVNSLVSDIKRYVDDNPNPIENVAVKDIVLAELPDDCVYERAIIEEVIDETKVKCFFVDNGDWRVVRTDKLKPITEKLIKQIPFQAIECRLVGVKPPGDSWSEFSSNWLHDNCWEDSYGDPKIMFVKYFIKEKAEVTGGHKYGVTLLDTSKTVNLVINKRLIDLNLAAIKEDELQYLEEPLNFTRETSTDSSSDLDEEVDLYNDKRHVNKDLIPIPIKYITDNGRKASNDSEINENRRKENIQKGIKAISHEERIHAPPKKLFAEPLRSVPLVSESDEDIDKWDVCLGDNFKDIVEPLGIDYSQCTDVNKANESESNGTIDKSIVPTHVESKSLFESEAEKSTVKPVKIKEIQSEQDIQKRKMFDENKATNQTYPSETDPNREAFRNRQLNQKGITEILNTSDVSELNELDILRDGIKDVSIYDSDDTLSVVSKDDTDPDICEKIKIITNKIANNNNGVLDSDDTLSTESGKVVKTEKPLKLLVTDRSIDSDDLATEDELVTQKSEHMDNITEKETQIAEITSEVPTNETLDKVEQLTERKNEYTATELKCRNVKITGSDPEIRTPQLVWSQDKLTVSIKIKIVGIEDYKLTSGKRSLQFETYQNDCKYAFDVELYGIIESDRTVHYNKGQYVLVKLTKFMKKPTKWLKLTKDIKNWITYDVDSLCISSDEESGKNDDALKVIMDHYERSLETDDDDDMPDDTALYRYRDD